MEGESSQSMKQEQKKKEKRKGEGRRGQRKMERRGNTEEIDCRGRGFCIVWLQGNRKNSQRGYGWVKKRFGDRYMWHDASRVDYTLRGEHLQGAVRKPPVWGLSSSSEEGGRRGDYPGPQSFIKVWSCLASVVQATASRMAGSNDSYEVGKL